MTWSTQQNRIFDWFVERVRKRLHKLAETREVDTHACPTARELDERNLSTCEILDSLP